MDHKYTVKVKINKKKKKWKARFVNYTNPTDGTGRSYVYHEHVNPLHIYQRDKGTCQICGEKIDFFLSSNDKMSLAIDHILPYSIFPIHAPFNLQAVHKKCNSSKRNRCRIKGYIQNDGTECTLTFL